MPAQDRHVSDLQVVGALRITVGVAILIVLVAAYADGATQGRRSAIDFLGYFTNQTSVLASLVLVVSGLLSVQRKTPATWLATTRGVAVASLLVVAVIYNVLVPGTASAPAWVSGILHGVFPILVALDWVVVGDRPPLPWQRLWAVLPYPLLWLAITLFRGRTDGWVPYGFLLPEHGWERLSLHVAGLLIALLLAGCLTWAASRGRGLVAQAPPGRATP